ncbi:endonuclease/exonuclease/phosphatase family protein [Pseudonocardia sp. Cha107L01]|uniref:endonuclease/exonuclease/phosphatase family protein n=1 Tax=Pseudonocardia sp. Cha107L01 TaxID=3457576 RepID=UPI00403EBE96
MIPNFRGGRSADRRTGHRPVQILLVGIPFAGMSLLWLAPELFGLGTASPFAQAVAMRPMTATGQLALAALIGLIRRRWWPAALAVGWMAAVALGAVVPRAVAGPPPPLGAQLSILSFNVLHGRADVAAVREHRPDLVVLPEAGQRFRDRLDPLVGDLGYSGWVTTSPGEPDGLGILMLAAPGLGALTATPLALGTRLCWLRVSGGTLGTVSVIAVHTAGPIRGWMPEWAPELGLLSTWLTKGRGPHIVVGDVNATLDHASPRAAVAGAFDVAADRGQGLKSTWPAAWPRWFGVQIDHVFTSGGVHPAGARVLDLPGSDLRALLARVVLPPGSAHTGGPPVRQSRVQRGRE